MTTRKVLFQRNRKVGKDNFFQAKFNHSATPLFSRPFVLRITVAMTSLCRRVLDHVALDVEDDRAADGETVSATVDATARGTWGEGE